MNTLRNLSRLYSPEMRWYSKARILNKILHIGFPCSGVVGASCLTKAIWMSWRLKYTYGRDVVGYCQLRLTIRCRHPAPCQDLIPLQRLHVFAHSRDPHPAIKLWCQVPLTKSKTIFQIVMYCMQCFLKSNILKVELSMIKIGQLLRKLWSFRSCFLILPPGTLIPQGIEGATKRDMSKHWCTIQWCASRGWFIAHENWTSCCRKSLTQGQRSFQVKAMHPFG